MLAAIFTAWFFISFWIGFFSPSAHADPYLDCYTQPGSGYSYTYCHWTDPDGYRHGTVTTCYSSNHCTTSTEH